MIVANRAEANAVTRDEESTAAVTTCKLAARRNDSDKTFRLSRVEVSVELEF